MEEEYVVVVVEGKKVKVPRKTVRRHGVVTGPVNHH